MEVFTARIASAMGAVFARNWLKERGGFRPVPIITFVGSPTIVAIPPTFAANTDLKGWAAAMVVSLYAFGERLDGGIRDFSGIAWKCSLRESQALWEQCLRETG